MLTGIVHWLRLRTGTTEKTPRVRASSFEPLEPRVLFSADLAGVPPILAGEADPAGQAIHIDLNEHTSEQQQESAPMLTLEASPGVTYSGGTDGLLAGPLDLPDATPPTIDNVSVSPTWVPLGGNFLITYTVSDSGGSGLSSVELWGTNDLNTWQFIAQNSGAMGDGPVTGYLSATRSAEGDWWYRIDVYDAANNSTRQTPPLHVDLTAPSPNSSEWAVMPHPTGPTSMQMAAMTATDVSGVEYYFDELSGNPGADDSGWQDSNTYEDAGLLPSTTYIYQVKTRDKSPNHNETAYSNPASAMTDPDITPPAPSPSTWVATPYATGTGSVFMAAKVATDVSGVEYYFDETSGNLGGTDSGWQDSNEYEDTGLSTGTVYTYVVRTRDRSINHNVGADSTPASVTTPGPVYRFWSPVLQRHFYTIKEGEKNKLEEKYSATWTYEKVAYYAFAGATDPIAAPVYRFWSASLQTHFYTMSEAERNKLINNYSNVWTDEGVAFYTYSLGAHPQGTSAVYRFWSDRLQGHFYTISSGERDKLLNDDALIWAYELDAWYAYPA